jgi:hypothetical protein
MEDPSGYLYRTAMNAFRSWHRRSALAAKRTIGLTRGDESIAMIDEQDAVVRSLEPLSPRQRAAVVLIDLLGYSSEEAGRMMGIRASTVRTASGTATRRRACALACRSRSCPRPWDTRGRRSRPTRTSTSFPEWASRRRPLSRPHWELSDGSCGQVCGRQPSETAGRSRTVRDAGHRLSSTNATRQDDAVPFRTRSNALSRRRSRDRSPSGARRWRRAKARRQKSVRRGPGSSVGRARG